MAKIVSVKRIYKEQFPNDVQKWIDQLLYPLNNALSQFVFAFNNNITLSDNLIAATKSFTLTGTSIITGDTTTGSNTIQNAEYYQYTPTNGTNYGVQNNLIVQGIGITSGTTISNIYDMVFSTTATIPTVTSSSPKVLTSVVGASNFQIGQAITGPGIPSGTVITAVGSTTLTMSNPSSLSTAITGAVITTTPSILLSNPVTATQKNAKIIVGGQFPYSFQHGLASRPTILLLDSCIESTANPPPATEGIYIDWAVSGSNIIINNITGLTAGRSYNITVTAMAG